MNTREPWSKILIIVGYLAMLVGAVDPLEGSLAVLPGSALVALGTLLSQSQRRRLAVAGHSISAQVFGRLRASD